MKRSDINQLVREAKACFEAHGWALPPEPRWDVTDLGLGNWREHGLVLVNLAEEPEYCEKLMYAKKGMVTPSHYHKSKKEDIICRWGELAVKLNAPDGPFQMKLNGRYREIRDGDELILKPGHRVTLEPGMIHSFWPTTDECIIGEVSTANDDLNDSFFLNPDVGRFPAIEEDEPAAVKLLGDR